MRSRYSAFKHILFLLFFFFLIPSCDSNNPGDPSRNTEFEAEESFSYGLAIVNHTRFSIVGINGTIEITGSAGSDSIRIEGERTIGSDSIEDAEDHLDDLRVQITDLSSEIQVETDQPDNTGGREYRVDYRVTLPASFEVSINNVNGNITFEALGNSVAVDNVNGNVEFENVTANTAVELSNGNIIGNITLQLDGTVSLDLANGNVELSIPNNTSAEFSARVTNGNIQITSLNLNDADYSSNSVTGTLGSGRGTISIELDNGNITVTGS